MDKDNKKRLVFMQNILEKYSDEDHPLTTAQIMELLKSEYGMAVHRTTVAKDIADLQELGVDVEGVRSTQNRYFIGERYFEIPELKLLVDAVASSKFISDKKSRDLIGKLDNFASVYQREEIKRNIHVESRIKPDNERTFYIVDRINSAINKGKKISFTYFEYDQNKKRRLRNDGMAYVLSPYTLVWQGDYYYVVGYSDKHGKVGNFRVDRIDSLPTVTDIDAVPAPQDFDISEYITKVFHMYDGQRKTVKLVCENEMMKVIVDRFGLDAATETVDDEHFAVTTEVSLSPNFFGWLFGFGSKIRLAEPENAVEMYRQLLKEELERMERGQQTI